MFGAPAAAILLVLGCSSSKHSASNDAALVGLKVSGGIGAMTPAFAPTKAAYTLPTVYGGDPGSITVTPYAEDENATITVNGVATPNNTPVKAIPLAVGDNKVTIVVTAQDGKTTQTYTIACKVYAQNTSVKVMDSVNGSPLPAAMITVADASGNVLQTGIPVDANGTATLGLDGKSAYNISALAPGSAQSLYQGFDSSKETSTTFYCHPLGMIAFPALAPKITAMSYGPDGTKWTPVTGDTISDTLANLGALQVSALGSSNVAVTSWSGFGMGLNIDAAAVNWYQTLFGVYAVEEQAIPVAVGTDTWYRTTMDMGLPPIASTAANTKHTLDLVTFDSANNRTEKHIYLNVTDGAPDVTQTDLSTLTPTAMRASLGMEGLCRNLFGATSGAGTGYSRMPYFTFSVPNGAGFANITGAEILRSIDGANWTKICTKSYYSPTSAKALQVFVPDPSFQDGVRYFFKVRCFNANTTNNHGYTQDSQVIAATFLPPFTANLVSPAASAVSMSLRPTLTFSISNPALFNPAVSDYFYFYLWAREKTDTTARFGQAYRYNFLASRFEILTGGVWTDTSATVSIDATHSNISILPAAGYFQPTLSYEWTIFGTAGDTDSSKCDACYFIKYDFPYNYVSTDPNRSYGYGFADGSTSEQGNGAVNGFFTLTIDPNAK
jgi:hypothetical protein